VPLRRLSELRTQRRRVRFVPLRRVVEPPALCRLLEHALRRQRAGEPLGE
jgi:hypothetical protein